MTSATLETLKAATDHFGAVLGRVEPDQYELATPCTEWSVVQLVDHVVVGTRWAGMILRGADGRAALVQILSTPLSDDRRVDWLAAGAEQLAAFADPGALERTVAHPIGPTPARAFLHLRMGDLVVHAWDLAHAVGGDAHRHSPPAARPPKVSPFWPGTGRVENDAPKLSPFGQNRARRRQLRRTEPSAADQVVE